MIKFAYTASELAALQLPGYPAQPKHMSRLATQHNWPSQPRKGAGGGREFPFATLPPALQQAILRVAADASPAPAAAQAAPDKAEDRRFIARANIVSAFKAHVRRTGQGMMAAEQGFIALYAAQRDSGAAEPFPRWLFDVYPTFSAASLRLWRTKEPTALRDGYGNRKGQSILARANDGAVAKAIEAIICERQLLAAGHIRDLVRIDFGTTLQLDGRTVALPKIRAFERYINAWKLDNPQLYERAINPDGWRNKFMLALGDADANIIRLNQRWEIDASPMDILCTDGRYLIYALIDVWSRRLMIHVSRTATTEGSLQLLRRACLEWGMPETLRTDNGSDFTSQRFSTALPLLGIEPIVSGPFQPWKKAYVERVIKTFQHRFAATMPGFIGHSVADRKKIESVKSFADNLGADAEAKFRIELTHAELQKHIDNWVAGHYHQTPHSGLDGMTPLARVQSSTIRPRMVQNVRALDVLLAPIAGTRVIGKEGLRVEGAKFWDNTLVPYIGKSVIVRHDPDDMGRVYVFDLDQKFICEATNYDRLGADRATVASAAKAAQRKHINEELKGIRTLAKKEYSPGKLAEKVYSDAAQAAQRVKPFPKQTEVYTTPSLDEAARAVQRAQIPHERTAEQTARQEAFVEDFKKFQQQSARHQRSNVDRWKDRARGIETRLAAGLPVDAEDMDWIAAMKTESWFIAWKATEAHKATIEGQ